MATQARMFQVGSYYHVYNRGNRKDKIFPNNEDYSRFLAKLSEYSRRDGVGIAAWCLMPNHFHLIVSERQEGSISRMMRSLSTSTAKYYNWQYGTVGHLCQERFQARLVTSEADLLNVTAYVHANPSQMSNYKTYRWSSYKAYAVGELSPDMAAVLAMGSLSNRQYLVYVDSYVHEKQLRQPISGVIA